MLAQQPFCIHKKFTIPDLPILRFLLFKNFDYPEKPLKYKHIRRISD